MLIPRCVCVFTFQLQMASYKQLKEFSETEEKIPKNTILIPDWLMWMFHYIDFWTLVSRSEQGSYSQWLMSLADKV